MTDFNPYDFLSDDGPSLNGSSSDFHGTAQAVAEKEATEPEVFEPQSASNTSASAFSASDDDFASPYAALDAEDDAKTEARADLLAHAPQGAVAREESVAALEARESYENKEKNGASDSESSTNGRADYESSYANLNQTEQITAYETVPELAPLADGGAPPPPSDSERAILQPQEPVNPQGRDHEMDIWSHLGELRSRMIKAILAVFITSSVAWNFVGPIQNFLLKPVLNVLKAHDVGKDNPNPFIITVTDPMQAFTTYFQLALVAGVIAAAPIVLWQMWRFIEPALTHNERRYSSLLIPFSITLFFLGCALGYYTSPLFFNFFLAFVPPGAAVMWTYTSVVTLLGKMLLVFGVCFQVPVITIFLNKTGIVSRNILIEYWRHVVVIIFIVVAVLTPTWDPLTMTICALPPCILYALSIWLIKWL